MGIGKHNYGGWEVPRYAICELENHKSQCCNSVRVKAREPVVWLSVRGHGGWRGTAVVKSKDAKLGAQMSEGRRRWRSQLKETEGANSCFCFVVLFPSSRIGWRPSTVIRADLLSLLVIQMLISSTNTLTDSPGNNVLPALWTTCSPVKLT